MKSGYKIENYLIQFGSAIKPNIIKVFNYPAINEVLNLMSLHTAENTRKESDEYLVGVWHIKQRTFL